MRYIGYVFGFIWKLWFLLVMTATTLFFYPFMLIFIVWKKDYKTAYRFCRMWASSILVLIGIYPKLIDRKNLPDESCVFIANHTSQLDIVVPYTVLKNQISFLGKKELEKIPVFNVMFKGMNVTVDRRSLVSGANSMMKCSEKLSENTNMIIFPEGTRSKEAPKMRNFKNGAFKLAIANRKKIVPLVFLDNYNRLEGGKGIFKSKSGPGRSRIVVLPPIDTRGYEANQVDDLKEKAFAAMQQTLEKYKVANRH